MNEVIQVDETTRIRHMDELNWVVERLKNRTSRNGATYQEWSQANGDKYGPFFCNPADAVVWLLDYKFGNSGFSGTFEEAVDEYRRIARRLRTTIVKAVS